MAPVITVMAATSGLDAAFETGRGIIAAARRECSDNFPPKKMKKCCANRAFLLKKAGFLIKYMDFLGKTHDFVLK